MRISFFSILFYLLSFVLAESIPSGAFSITRIHYNGGGDWYADPSSLPNLLHYIKSNTNIIVNPLEQRSKIGDDIFLSSSYFYLTGHGNIKFNNEEAQILRDQLLAGAFLHADDNYGMDKSFRREMQNIFPEKDWVEIPANHLLFNIYYNFPNGLPKIHEHDNKPPQAFGIFHNKKLILLYTYESDLGDGWEDKNVHNDSEQIRLEALKMGTNIIIYNLIQ